MNLIKQFEGKGDVPASDIFVLAKKEGISATAVERAKRIMNIKSEREAKGWIWKL